MKLWNIKFYSNRCKQLLKKLDHPMWLENKTNRTPLEKQWKQNSLKDFPGLKIFWNFRSLFSTLISKWCRHPSIHLSLLHQQTIQHSHPSINCNSIHPPVRPLSVHQTMNPYIQPAAHPSITFPFIRFSIIPFVYPAIICLGFCSPSGYWSQSSKPSFKFNSIHFKNALLIPKGNEMF